VFIIQFLKQTRMLPVPGERDARSFFVDELRHIQLRLTRHFGVGDRSVYELM